MGEQEGAVEAEKQEVGKVSERRIGIVNFYSNGYSPIKGQSVGIYCFVTQ
jgi:hypothetical protein